MPFVTVGVQFYGLRTAGKKASLEIRWPRVIAKRGENSVERATPKTHVTYNCPRGCPRDRGRIIVRGIGIEAIGQIVREKRLLISSRDDLCCVAPAIETPLATASCDSHHK